MNSVALIGRLTRDPEQKFLSSGKGVVNFGLAVDPSFKREEGQPPYFFDCVAWEKTADFVAGYFSKGKPIAITGELQQRTWVDADGQKKSKVEIRVDRARFVPKDNSNADEDVDIDLSPAVSEKSVEKSPEKSVENTAPKPAPQTAPQTALKAVAKAAPPVDEDDDDPFM